jgi:hypothetical protein
LPRERCRLNGRDLGAGCECQEQQAVESGYELDGSVQGLGSLIGIFA